MVRRIEATRYYDQAGAFLWQDDVQLRRLWGVGNEVVMNYEHYIVTAVKVELGVQYVTLVKGTVLL